MSIDRRCLIASLVLGTAFAPSPVLAVGPDNSTLANDPEFRKAEDLIQQEKWAEALPYLLRIEADIKNNADVYNYLGIVYRKHRDFTTARQYYNRALQIDPEHRPTLAYLGEWHIETGDPSGAIETFRKLRRICLDCRETHALDAALRKAGIGPVG
jgi:Flp pilus assembly protein TadD